VLHEIPIKELASTFFHLNRLLDPEGMFVFQDLVQLSEAELDAITWDLEDFQTIFLPSHFSVTAIPDEISKLDSGLFGGWVRTGRTFGIWNSDTGGLAAVCRFFSTAFGSKSTHFYTPISDECQTVKANADWQFEAVAFFMVNTDVNGNCPAGTTPLFRLYNNGMGGAPNHAYTNNRAKRDALQAKGWVPEGSGPQNVFACTPPLKGFVTSPP